MPIATSLAATLFASSLLAHAGTSAAPATFSTPPMIVNVSAPGMSPSIVKFMLEETDAIWRGSGVTFVWRSAAREMVPYSRTTEAGPYLPSTLRVVIGHESGMARAEGQLPLGWIVFDDVTTPGQEVYVSYANAVRFIQASRLIVGMADQMPTLQRDMLLARAMGRALAHELGHYLLASKVHTARGLMKAIRSASEFFAPDRGGFAIDAGQRRQMAARMRGESLVVSR